jgi:hypothetical protein
MTVYHVVVLAFAQLCQLDRIGAAAAQFFSKK